MTSPPAGTRAARRAESARRIREAAQLEFAEHGYDATTIRAVAARAGVDPALVLQHHGSKTELFRSVTRLDRASADDVAAHLDEVVDARVAGLPPELRALTRSMLTAPEAEAAMKEYLDERVATLARATGGPSAEVDAALVVCALLGMTLGRHFLHLDALTDVSDEELSRAARAFLRRPGPSTDPDR